MNYFRLLPGNPYPLGANWDGRGTNFALFSENAESVELLLFDEAKTKIPTQYIRFIKGTTHVWQKVEAKLI